MKKHLTSVALLVLLISCGGRAALAAAPAPEEFAESRKWAAAKFEGVPFSPKIESGLAVLANHDPVQLNNRNGRPMRLGEKDFPRGIYCHAVSKVVVRLPGPGKDFSAIVGVDNNENTMGGAGSVVFSVSVGAKKAFDSGVMKAVTPAKPVKIDLGGATEFTLEVGDAGDGISADQADWATLRSNWPMAGRSGSPTCPSPASSVRPTEPNRSSRSPTAASRWPNLSASGKPIAPPEKSTTDRPNAQ